MLDMPCASTGISSLQKKVSDGCCDDSRGQPVNINLLYKAAVSLCVCGCVCVCVCVCVCLCVCVPPPSFFDTTVGKDTKFVTHIRIDTGLILIFVYIKNTLTNCIHTDATKVISLESLFLRACIKYKGVHTHTRTHARTHTHRYMIYTFISLIVLSRLNTLFHVW